MGGPQRERRFAKTVKVKASPERVWEALIDPFSLSWMSKGCLYTVPVPPDADVDAELRCVWRRASSGLLAGGVVEVTTLEAHRRVRYLDHASPRSLRFEFTVKPARAGCRVEVAGFWNQAGRLHGPIPALSSLVWWRAGHLPGAVQQAPQAEPEFPLYALEGAGEHPHEVTCSIDIAAPPDVIWAVADDPDGTRVGAPDMVRHWRSVTPEAELMFSVNRLDSGGGLTTSVARVVHHGPYHVTTKGAVYEVEHRLLPRGAGGELTTIHRGARNLPPDHANVAEEGNAWLARVKAAAESLAHRR